MICLSAPESRPAGFGRHRLCSNNSLSTIKLAPPQYDRLDPIQGAADAPAAGSTPVGPAITAGAPDYRWLFPPNAPCSCHHPGRHGRRPGLLPAPAVLRTLPAAATIQAGTARPAVAAPPGEELFEPHPTPANPHSGAM